MWVNKLWVNLWILWCVAFYENRILRLFRVLNTPPYAFLWKEKFLHKKGKIGFSRRKKFSETFTTNYTSLKRIKNYKEFERVNANWLVSVCFELLHERVVKVRIKDHGYLRIHAFCTNNRILWRTLYPNFLKH